MTTVVYDRYWLQKSCDSGKSRAVARCRHEIAGDRRNTDRADSRPRPKRRIDRGLINPRRRMDRFRQALSGRGPAG